MQSQWTVARWTHYLDQYTFKSSTIFSSPTLLRMIGQKIAQPLSPYLELRHTYQCPECPWHPALQVRSLYTNCVISDADSYDARIFFDPQANVFRLLKPKSGISLSDSIERACTSTDKILGAPHLLVKCVQVLRTSQNLGAEFL